MSAETRSQMLHEIAEMPEAVERLALPDAQAALDVLVDRLKSEAIRGVLTIARGSSHHAATYLGFAIQYALGLPVASVGPSISSIFGKRLKSQGFLALAISQSGQSEDIITLCESLRSEGADVIAVTNKADSLLAKTATQVLDIRAGPEKSVAATKSFLNSVVAGLWGIARSADDMSLQDGLVSLPQALIGARPAAWAGEMKRGLLNAKSATVLGRGAGLGLAQEIALKLTETSGIRATAYSGAEILHGPNAMIGEGHPVIMLPDGAQTGLDQAARQLSQQGAQIIEVKSEKDSHHPLIDPLVSLQALYLVIEELARLRGYEPDRPKHLLKETQTV